jgi:dihydroxyacetone kinase
VLTFDAPQHALNQLYRYTRARPPSRTLVDPLASFVGTLAYDPADLDKAFEAAKEAAEATQFLDAKIGRAAYVGEDRVKEAEVPECVRRRCGMWRRADEGEHSAGAWGVHRLLEGVRKAILDAEADKEPRK